MLFDGRMGVVSGRYHSVDGLNGSKSPSTVLELFGRTEHGESICALVHGLRPTFEISPLMVWSEGMEVPDHVTQRLAAVAAMEDVIGIEGPVLKLTDLGQRPVWSVTVRQPFVVPSLRKTLAKQSWQIFSGDIPFLNRLFLDQGLGMHLSLKGSIIDRRADEDDDFSRLEAVRKSGGAGRYAVDCTVVCELADLEASEPFPVPYKVFSFDLETSIAHDTILCAAAVIEDLHSGHRQTFSFVGEEQSIMEELTLVVRSQDPDIITGYNIDNFDLPRLNDRMGVHARSKDWRKRGLLFGWGRVQQTESEAKRTRSGLFPRRQSSRAWNVAGRTVVDAWWQARMALRPQRETLSFISNLLFPD